MMVKRFAAAWAAVLILMMSLAVPASAAVFATNVDTTSGAVFMLNLDTGIVVYEKNSAQRMFPASTTKIMTYIVTVENVPDVKNTKVSTSLSEQAALFPVLNILPVRLLRCTTCSIACL